MKWGRELFVVLVGWTDNCMLKKIWEQIHVTWAQQVSFSGYQSYQEGVALDSPLLSSTQDSSSHVNGTHTDSTKQRVHGKF